MKHIHTTVFLLFLLIVSPLQAQVSVDVTIDSLQLLIGEQTGITLGVSCGTKQKVVLPALKAGDELVPNVEVVDVLPADTEYINDGKRMQLHQRYVITAWDSSLYYLPPMELAVDGKKYETNNLALKVYTLDVDTLHPDSFFPPNTVMDPPLVWEDYSLVFYLLLLVVVLMALSYTLYIFMRIGKPLTIFKVRKKKTPPHKVAIERISQIKNERKWAEEDSKEYYTQLTDTLRNYIQERYHFNALEMTSNEIIQNLLKENDEEALRELKEIFTTADLVKFAKWNTLINENDANLMAAVDFINQTKVEFDPNSIPEPEPVDKDYRKKMSRVWGMRIAIGIIAFTVAGILAYCGWRLWDLLA